MKRNMPLVSVIIPVYNVEEYLEKSVESIINQTYKNIEMILVDDGSPDKCPEICETLKKQYSNIKVIHKKNGGLSDARNKGLEISSGEYILFLDSDDTLSNTAIEEYVNIAQKEKSDVVIPDRYFKVFESKNDKKLFYHFKKDFYISNPHKFATDVMIGKGRGWRASAVLYSSIIKKYKCIFPVGYTAEDIVFNLQVMNCVEKISFCQTPTLNYLKRANSITSTFNENFFDTILYIDYSVDEFFKKVDIDINISEFKRNSLLSRNVITYLFSVFSKNGLILSEQKNICKKIFNNDKVRIAFESKMETPYFNQKLLGLVYVVIHNLLKFKLYSISCLIIKTINVWR